MLDSWDSYPKIYALGHKALSEVDLLHAEVYVEEKVDGSQFSFGVFNEPTNHSLEVRPGMHLRARSKGRELPLEELDPANPEYNDGNFGPAVKAIVDRAPAMTLGWTYRGEVLARPKHNVLAYDRTPKGHVVIFDVNDQLQGYLSWPDKADAAADLGLEVVPLLYSGHVTYDDFTKLLETDAYLGGHKIEGVVLKPHQTIYGVDKKAVFGKFVSEEFKEKHETNYPGSRSPSKGSAVDRVVAQLATEARFHKTVQHLRDEGVLEHSPRDIGILIGELKKDLIEEEGEWMAEMFFKEFADTAVRRIVSQFPQWYKEQLAQDAFEEVVSNS